MKSDEITVERLRKALGEVVLKPKWQPPSDEALNALAAYLEELRQAVSENLRERQRVHAEVLRYICALRDLFPILEQQDKAAAEGIRDAELPLHRLAQSIGPESSPRFWEGRLNTQWEDYAEEIAANFRRAMHSTNTRYIGLSQGGPVASFIYTVAPWVTREKPSSVSAVAKAMRDRAKKKREKESRLERYRDKL